MSYIFCLIIVAAAVQTVQPVKASTLIASNVHEVYVQSGTLEKGLTVSWNNNILGNFVPKHRQPQTEATIEDAMNVIFKDNEGRIAFAQVAPEENNYLVIPKRWESYFKLRDVFRYEWSKETPEDLNGCHLKMVTHVEGYDETHLEIQYKGLECKSKSHFGDMVLHFGKVVPSIVFYCNITVYKEKSKESGKDDALLTKPFSQLRLDYIGKTFKPDFEDEVLKNHPVLKEVGGEIAEFTVTVITKSGTNTVVVDRTTAVEKLVQTILKLGYGPEVSDVFVAKMDEKFKYTIAFNYKQV